MTETDKVALVTGATSGVGRACAIRFANDGYHVGAIGRNREAADSVMAEIAAAGGSATALIADVRDREALDREVGPFLAEAGRLDVTVTAAGVAFAAPTESMPTEDFELVMDTNLLGVFHLAQLSIEPLCATGGAFIAIGSGGGTFASQGMAAYCASKFAVNGFVKSMALDYGYRGVRCNVIAPGFVQTRMADGLLAAVPPDMRASFQKRTPLGRFARPEEIADAVAYLASDRGAYVNGAVHAVDGGVTAGWYTPPE